MKVVFQRPQPKQEEFLKATEKHIGYGGARGGGKSWSVRQKAKVLGVLYSGIRMLLVRRTYQEVTKNHLDALKHELKGNTVKDINSKYNKYNLVVSVFNSKDKYIDNIINKAVSIEYEKEDLPQVNRQLHESLEIINDKSSNNNVSQNDTVVNNSNIQEKPKFSLKEPVEGTKDLIAVHNISETNLLKSLELGGFPMPSIAIMKRSCTYADKCAAKI